MLWILLLAFFSDLYHKMYYAHHGLFKYPYLAYLSRQMITHLNNNTQKHTLIFLLNIFILILYFNIFVKNYFKNDQRHLTTTCSPKGRHSYKAVLMFQPQLLKEKPGLHSLSENQQNWSHPNLRTETVP